MNKIIWKKGINFIICGLLIGTSVLPNICGDDPYINTDDNLNNDRVKKCTENYDIIKNASLMDICKFKNINNEISENNVTICIKKYDNSGEIIELPIGSTSIETTYFLKDELKQIWEKNIPIANKIKNSIYLLEGEVSNLQLPLRKIFQPLFNKYENSVPKNDKIFDVYSDEELFNFISMWGALCFGQPNVYLIGGNRDIQKWVIKEYPDGGGYNISLFMEYGISSIMLPFIGWGFFASLGLLGFNMIPNNGYISPTTFLALLFGVLFISLSFKIGSPYLSVFELYFGVSGISLAFPV